MSQLIDYMKELGLTNLEQINTYIMETDIDTLKVFDEYMQDLAQLDWNISEYSPYLFAPSMDLSGFGGCGELTCKIERAIRFNKFASLYSDTSYLIVDSITNPHPVEITSDTEEQYRYDLLCDYSLILIYSDLIDNNIAKIIPPHFSVCPDCFSKLIVNKNELSLLDPLIEQYCQKTVLNALIRDDRANISCIEIKNLPELFPNHNGYIASTNDDINKFLSNINSFPAIIDDEKVKKKIVKNLTLDNYFTSKYETYLSSAYQSKYITSKPLNEYLFNCPSKNTISSTPLPVFEMPFFENLDTKTILKLRETEHHAFEDYRISLDRATTSYLSEPTQIKNIYDDIIYPAFVKLDGLFDKTKKMRFVKGVGELAVISSTVTLGLMNSIIPADPLGIATALGGTGALVNHLSNVVERKLNSGNELEKQDFYFLWQIKKKS